MRLNNEVAMNRILSFMFAFTIGMALTTLLIFNITIPELEEAIRKRASEMKAATYKAGEFVWLDQDIKYIVEGE